MSNVVLTTEYFLVSSSRLLQIVSHHSSLWPPKTSPLYFTAVIFYLFFDSVSIDERPVMGSQPNLASRSEVVSIYKCTHRFRGPSPQIWGAKNITFWTTFSATSVDTTYLGNETSHQQTKMLVSLSIYNVSPKSWLTFRDI